MTWKKPTREERYNRHWRRNHEPLPLAQSIARNRRKHARFQRAERVLRSIRLQIFDIEDADAAQGTNRAEKARRVMDLCQQILAPFHESRRRTAQAAKLARTPSAFEPGSI